MLQANELLQSVSATYRSFQSYADRGVILWPKHGELPDEHLFRTWYLRPDRIRLDSRTHHPYPPLRHLVTNYSICANGSRIWTWQDRTNEIEYENEIELAFAGAVTLDVPNLLLPIEIGCFAYHELLHTHVETTHLEGRRCLCLFGEHPHGSEYRIWISENDYLVRKVRTDRRDSDGEQGSYTGVAETVYEYVAVDTPVDASVFEHVGSLLMAR